MKVECKYFGMIAEKTGVRTEMIEITATSNDCLRDFFENKYTEINGMTYKIAVDGILNGNLNENSKEIALLPPFAGG